jgi:aryl-alcohol dehydrogenase
MRATAAVFGKLLTPLTIEPVDVGDPGPGEVLVRSLITLNRPCRFPYDRLVRTFELDQVNDAINASYAGEVVKPVLRMPG